MEYYSRSPYIRNQNQASGSRLLNLESLDKLQNQRRRQIFQIQREIFDYLKLPFMPNDIAITQNQYVHAIFIPAKSSVENPQNYYLSHGFGGSSLTYFPVIEPLLSAGNVVLWEVRGMGLNIKLQKYDCQESQLGDFFINPIDKMIDFYQHQSITLIGHSFSGYICLLYSLQNRHNRKFIRQLILLSPVGITPKQEDHNNEINSFGDCLRTALHKFGWFFELSYKSVLRTVCYCCKDKIIFGSYDNVQLTQKQKQLMTSIIKMLILLPDGSQTLFFKYFLPKALPKFPIEPMIDTEPTVRATMIFGSADQDWADVKGPLRLSEKYPSKMRVLVLQKCNHNIHFNIPECRRLFQQLAASANS